MAADLRAFIQVASNANVFFNNTSEYDLIVYPTSNTQKILIGNTSNTAAGITITSNAVCLASNVGIGRSNPAYTLDVAGDVNFTGTMRQNGTAFQTSRWTSNASGVFIMSNVGIGTNSPAYALDVASTTKTTRMLVGAGGPGFTGLNGSNTTSLVLSGAQAATGAHIYTYSQDAWPNFQLGNWSHTNVSLGFDVYFDGNWRNSTSTTPGYVIYKTGDLLCFYISPKVASAGATTTLTPIMCMSNTNVGIGTTTPNAALQLSNVLANRRIVLWEGANNDHQYYGFGVNNGIFRYQIDATTAQHAFYAATSASTSAEIMRIQGNGNVGIGTTSPSATLHVNGNTTINGKLYNESLLYAPPSIGVSGGTGDKYVLSLGTASEYPYSIGIDAGTMWYSTPANTMQRFFIGGAERFRIQTSNISVTAHVIPTSNEVFDLGTSNMRFRDLYLSGNTIFMGSNYTIGTDSNTDTLTLLDRRTNLPIKFQAREIVLTGSNNAQRVMRVDDVAGPPTSMMALPRTQFTALAMTSPADNSWISVCWSPERGIFVAVAESGTGNRVMTSPDGVTWTARTSAADNNWFDVCWSPERGIFVAVGWSGVGNRVMTSPDGITWTTRTSAVDNGWTAVCWSPQRGLFVAVAVSGTGNRVMTSPDGITWTTRTSAADNNWYSVCWSPDRGIFVAVAWSGTGNRVMTSPDGITWTARTPAVDNAWISVCWSQERGLFVAVAESGTGNRVMTSPDGITWTARTSAADIGWRSVCWAAERGIFLAVAYTGTGNRIMTSPDGITWTIRTSAADNNWDSVCWAPQLGIFAAVAVSGTGNRVMTMRFEPEAQLVPLTMRGGMTNVMFQATARTSAADNNWYGVCWSPERSIFVAVAMSGTGNRVMTSPDGITWTARTSAADNNWISVCWSPERSLFVAVAGTGTGNRVMTSPDGITWTARTSAADNQWRSVCWSPERGLFVAVADSGTGNRVMTSPDGITWTARTSAADNGWWSVCWSAERGLFVAVAMSGTGNRVMTSPDGITWTARTSAANNGWLSVCWSRERGLFVAVAESGTGNRAMTSPDGITWTARASAIDNSWHSVCWSSERGIFLAVSYTGTGNRIMTSPDGINWTIRTSPADNQWASVCWSPQLGIFAAVALTGTGNRVMTMQANQMAFAEAMTVGDTTGSGVLSVGLSNPAERLHVAGKIRSEIQFLNNSTANAAVPCYSFAADSNTGMYSAAADALGFVTGGTEKVRIDSAGNVMIGNTSTSVTGRLSASTGANTGGGTNNIFFTNADGGVRVVVHDNHSTGGVYRDLISTAKSHAFNVGLNVEKSILTLTSDNTGESRVISLSGSVGIGTTSPAYALDVATTARTPQMLVGTGGPGFSGLNGLITNGLVLSGAQSSTLGAHIHLYSQDAWPNLQLLNWSHNNISLAFDTYADGTNWRNSTSTTPGYSIYKVEDRLDFYHFAKVASAGAVSTFNRIMCLSNTNVGIGTSTPAYNLDVNGTIMARSGNTGASITSNQILFGFNNSINYTHAIKTRHNSGANDSGNAVDFFVWQTTDAISAVGTKHVMSATSAGVGIGKTAPAYSLDVAGGIFVGNSSFITTSSAVAGTLSNMLIFDGLFNEPSAAQPANKIRLHNHPSWVGGFGITNNTLNYHSGGIHAFWTGTSNSVYGNQRLTITAAGDVGIGTTTPSAQLHVAGSTLFSGTIIANPSTGGVHIGQYSANRPGIELVGSEDGIIDFTTPGVDSRGRVYYNHGTNYMTLNTNNAERIRIDSAGNVGIGTSSPSTKLHIVGNGAAFMLSPVTATGSSYIEVQNTFNSATVRFLAGADGAGFTGTAGQGSIATWSAHPLVFFTNGVERLRMLSTGNIGIGTVAPSYRLDVSGTARASQILIGTSTDTSASRLISALDSTMTSALPRMICFGKENNSRNQAELAYHHVADGSVDNRMSLGFGGILVMNMLAGGNVGIGTTAPAYNLDVNGTILARSGNTNIGSTSNQILFSYNNTALHTHAIKTRHNGGANDTGNAIDFYVWQTSDATSAVGTKQVMSVTSAGVGIGTTTPINRLTVKSNHSDANTGFCLDAGDGSTYQLRIYAFVQGNSQVGYKFDVLNTSATNTALTLGHNGNVGIGTTAPTHPLHVATQVGNVSIQANFDIVAFSDRRLKEDLTPITDALTKINNITGYTYKRLGGDVNKKVAGVVAQEVKEVLPEVVHEDADGMMSVAYGNMSALLIEAIKELKRENEALKCSYNALKQEVESLKRVVMMT